jgi:hypothetical protein
MQSTSRKWEETREWSLSYRRDTAGEIRFGKRVNMRTIFLFIAALSLISDCAFGQTTRTAPGAASTSRSIPSSSSTSPNSPCNSSNPTSPCYSANAPRNPCYNALAPNEPCSTTTTPNSPTSPAPSVPAANVPQGAVHALTADQARSQIEAEGYSRVTGLQKNDKGIWRGKAIKDGSTVSVTLDTNGTIVAK